MFAEIFKKTPARAPDRTALQLLRVSGVCLYRETFCADERLSHEKFDGCSKRDGHAYDGDARGKTTP